MNDLSKTVNDAVDTTPEAEAENAITTLKQAKQYYHGHGVEMDHEKCIELISEAVETLTHETTQDNQRVSDKLSKLDIFLREITDDDATLPISDDLKKSAIEISHRIDAYFKSEPSIDSTLG